MVEKSNRLGRSTDIKQPNPEKNIKRGIIKGYLYFLFCNRKKVSYVCKSFLYLINKHHVKYNSGTYDLKLRRRKVENLNKKALK